jgi:Skp family chaperone for outer membrane proteins
LRSGKTPSSNYEESIKAKQEELDKLEKKLRTLTGKESGKEKEEENKMKAALELKLKNLENSYGCRSGLFERSYVPVE